MVSSHDERTGLGVEGRRPAVERNARGAAGRLILRGMFKRVGIDTLYNWMQRDEVANPVEAFRIE